MLLVSLNTVIYVILWDILTAIGIRTLSLSLLTLSPSLSSALARYVTLLFIHSDTFLVRILVLVNPNGIVDNGAMVDTNWKLEPFSTQV